MTTPQDTQFTTRKPPSRARLPGGAPGRLVILPGFRSVS
jgi:hypothetical protein